MDPRAVTVFRLRWIVVCKYVCKALLLTREGTSPGVKLLSPMFNFLRNCQVIFQNGHTILRSHRQRTRVPVFLPPCQHFFFSDFFSFKCLKLKPSKWAWSGSSLQFSFAFPWWQAERLFTCLLASCVSSWGNACSSSLPTFELGCLLFCCWVVYYIGDIRLLSDMIFSHPRSCLFIFLTASFDAQSFWFWWGPICFVFCFLCFWWHIQEIIVKSSVMRIPSCVFFWV